MSIIKIINPIGPLVIVKGAPGNELVLRSRLTAAVHAGMVDLVDVFDGTPDLNSPYLEKIHFSNFRDGDDASFASGQAVADHINALVTTPIYHTVSGALADGVLTLTMSDGDGDGSPESDILIDLDTLTDHVTGAALVGTDLQLTLSDASVLTADLSALDVKAASAAVDVLLAKLVVTLSDASTFDVDITDLLSSGGAAGIFQGYTQNGTQMGLLSPADLDYTIRTDTDTIWQYQTATWVDTGQGSIHLESIVANAVAGIPTIASVNYSAPLSTTGGVVGVGSCWANTGSTGHNTNTVLFDQPILTGDTDKWWTWNAQAGTGGVAGHNFAVGITDTATSASLGNGALNSGWIFGYGAYGLTGSLWYTGPSTGVTGAGYITAAPFIVNGGDFRIGRDTDGYLKYQYKDAGSWITIAISASATLGDAADLYAAHDLYNGPAEGSSVVCAPEAPYAATAAPAQTGTYASTHYIDMDGTNDHVVFSGTNTDKFMDFDGAAGDWSIGWTWDGRLSTQPQNAQYMTLFSNGSNQIAFRQGGTNQGIYFRGSSTSSWGINTWYAPVLGDKYLLQFNAVAKTITVYRNNYLQGTVNAVHLVNTYNGADGVFTVGKGVNGWDSFDGGLSDIYLRTGTHLGTAQRDEYFLNADLTATSFYADAESIDFLRMGEETYPAANGLKGAVLGTYTNGNAADYVLK